MLARACKKHATRELNRRVTSGNIVIKSFVTSIDTLRQNAKHNGYALSVHGTLLRDIDLIAVPWISRPKAPSTLKKSLERIIKVLYPHSYSQLKPTIKPQGRIAYVIHLGNGTYIDLSIVTPR